MTVTLHRLVKLFACLALLSPGAGASQIVTVILSIGPSELSTSFTAYENNAEAAIQAAYQPAFENSTVPAPVHNAGTPGTPDYYSPLTSGTPAGGVLTTPDFNSWLGQDPPPANYEGEHGNAMYAGLAIYSSTPFTLSQVTLNSTFFGQPFSNDLSGTHFSGHLVGINTGTSTVYNFPGGAADASTPINELFTSGFGIFFNDTDPNSGSTSLQAYMNAINAAGSASFTVGIPGTSASVSTVATPEPAPALVGGFGLAMVLYFRRKRQSSAA